VDVRVGWPTQITSTGGIYVQKEGKSNISDTQELPIFPISRIECGFGSIVLGEKPRGATKTIRGL